MSPRRKLLLSLGLVAGVLGLTIPFLLDPEPQYQGRYLSDWMLLDKWWRSAGSIANAIEAQNEAIRNIGADGLPHLVRWMSFQPGKWRPRLLNCMPLVVRKKLYAMQITDWFSYRRESELAAGAHNAFRILGPSAAPAIPELTKLAAGWPARNSRLALDALLTIGPAAVPAVTNLIALTRTNALKAQIIRELSTIGFQAAPAVPALLVCLRSPNAEVAAQSADALGVIGRQPKLVIPALIEALDHPESLVRERAALAIADFGPDAQVAVPRLRRFLEATNKEAAAATIALRKIAPSEYGSLPPVPTPQLLP